MLYYINEITLSNWILLIGLGATVVGICYHINLRVRHAKRFKALALICATLLVLCVNAPVMNMALQTPVRQWQQIEVSEQESSTTIAQSLVKGIFAMYNYWARG